MDVSREIEEAINKNLPNAVGDVLRRRLEQAEKDARELAVTKKSLEESTKKAETAHKENLAFMARINELSTREGKVAEREAKVTEREVKIAVQDAIVEQMNRRLVDMKEIVQTVFQNNRFKYQTTDQIPVVMGPEYQGGPSRFSIQTVERTTESQG